MKNQFNTKDSQLLNYLVASLLDFFRDPRVEHRYFEAAKIAKNQISSVTGFSSRINLLEKRYLFFASHLKNNLSPKTLRTFAEECLTAAIQTGILARKNSLNTEENTRTLYKNARKQVAESLATGHGTAAAIERTANALIKNRREQEKIERMRRLASTHPLKDTLEALNIFEKQLAKEDIKNQWLKLNKKTANEYRGQGVLYQLLEKAAAFSSSRLHKLLGDELFFLCRPSGFLDQQSTIVLVDVPTSAHLHVLTYRKLEILRLLKKDVAFISVRNIRLNIQRMS